MSKLSVDNILEHSKDNNTKFHNTDYANPYPYPNTYTTSYNVGNKVVKCVIRCSKRSYSGVSGFVSFKYDPTLVNLVKTAPERWWNANVKEWEIPDTYLDNILTAIESKGYTISRFDERTEEEKQTTSVETKEIDIPNDYEFKTKAWAQFQLDCVKYGINNNSFMLGDQQGLGKTWQALQIACIRKKLFGIKHCLVICCVNPNKYNWMDEVEQHTFEKGYILGTRYRKRTGKAYIGSSEDKYADLININDSFFQITNIETLRYKKTIEVIGRNGVPKHKTVYPIADRIKELVDQGEIGYIIIDEGHRCKDSTSQQGRALLDIKDCPNVIMSGTFLLNSPIDLFTPLKMVGAERHSLTQFKTHYCVMGGYGGHQIVAYKNLGELQTLLSSVMIRRLKSEVLDLPPKIETVKYVELDKDQQAIYDEIREETIADIVAYRERQSNIDKVSTNMTPLTMLIRVRQATGNPAILTSKTISNAKFDMLRELAEELVANDEKFIVFSNWTAVLNDAYKMLANMNLEPALYTGENIKTREDEKQRFKTSKACKCICGTTAALGTGVTLTEATTVIFLDEPWNRGTKEQAEDRAYRIGTNSTVNIITLIAKDTIDERIHELIYKKGKMSDILVDKEVDAVANEKMVEYLLS